MQQCVGSFCLPIFTSGKPWCIGSIGIGNVVTAKIHTEATARGPWRKEWDRVVGRTVTVHHGSVRYGRDSIRGCVSVMWVVRGWRWWGWRVRVVGCRRRWNRRCGIEGSPSAKGSATARSGHSGCGCSTNRHTRCRLAEATITGRIECIVVAWVVGHHRAPGWQRLDQTENCTDCIGHNLIRASDCTNAFRTLWTVVGEDFDRSFCFLKRNTKMRGY